ncbi:MAG: radical SAM protein, partial [Bryobacterales bacterium]|nr:radical SAM protein [Bryobacterales bacterium]
QCIIPYATQDGEISFCAYNTGVGWRNIIEKMHMTATLSKWYDDKGRHKIYAGGKSVELESVEHRLVVNQEAAHAERQHDLDELGVAKTSREEKARARDAKMKEAARDAQMEKLYRQMVLNEPEEPKGNFVALDSLTGGNGLGGIAPAPAKKESDLVGTQGD